MMHRIPLSPSPFATHPILKASVDISYFLHKIHGEGMIISGLLMTEAMLRENYENENE
jgi:hypothetical protein